MKLRKILALVLATAAAAALGTLPADAGQRPQRLSHCGQTITAKVAYLAKDLTCTTGFRSRRAVDGADQLTVDLRGHRLQGRGSGTAFSVGDREPYVDSLTVRNGRVDHWDTAFRAAYATLVVTDLQVDHNHTALTCGGSTCTITDSRIEHNTTGTSTIDSGLVFTGNVFRGNAVASDASSTAGVSSSTYTDNLFRDNTVGVRIAPYGFVTLTQNEFRANGVGLQGLARAGASGYSADLNRNLFVDNRDGVHLVLADGEDSATLHDNVALRNTRYGFYAPGAVDGGGNQAAGNGAACVGVGCTRP